MKTLDEAVDRLRELKAMGYVKTHRSGPTGIGKTLEDLLGIEENNIAIANTTFAEIKSARKGSQSMLTLFTKAPLPDEANARMLGKYGYVTLSSKGRKVLHTTTWATGYNSLRGQRGFKVHVVPGKLALISVTREELGYWDEVILKDAFEKKLHHVLYVLADGRGKSGNEEFWFNEVWLLSGFNFHGFTVAVNEGVVCIDTRIGQYPDGRPHDHGTGFRVLPDKLSQCFRERKRLI